MPKRICKKTYTYILQTSGFYDSDNHKIRSSKKAKQLFINDIISGNIKIKEDVIIHMEISK